MDTIFINNKEDLLSLIEYYFSEYTKLTITDICYKIEPTSFLNNDDIIEEYLFNLKIVIYSEYDDVLIYATSIEELKDICEIIECSLHLSKVPFQVVIESCYDTLNITYNKNEISDVLEYYKNNYIGCDINGREYLQNLYNVSDDFLNYLENKVDLDFIVESDFKITYYNKNYYFRHDN